MYNEKLAGYLFHGAHRAGIDTATGIEYNLNTITPKQIEIMIQKGSKLFTIAPKPEPKKVNKPVRNYTKKTSEPKEPDKNPEDGQTE